MDLIVGGQAVSEGEGGAEADDSDEGIDPEIGEVGDDDDSAAAVAASVDDDDVTALVTAALGNEFDLSARSSVSTTLSTARRRSRWRAFCGLERRYGIFLVLVEIAIGRVLVLDEERKG